MANTRIKDLTTQKNRFLADDFLEKDGATDASAKISPLDAHGQFRNALAPRGGVAFDGTSSSRVTSTLTGQSIGTDPLSISGVLEIPLAAPSGTAMGLLYCGPSSTNASSSGTSIRSYLDTNGHLYVELFGATGTDYNRADVSGVQSAFAGKRIHLCIVRPASGNVAIYINGVAQTATFTTGGTPAGWQGSITSTYFGVGYLSTSEIARISFYSATLYNVALAAADALEIFEMGGGVPFRFQFGTQTPAYTSDFSAGVDSWGDAVGGNTLTGNVDSINGQNDWFSVQTGSTNKTISVFRTTPLGAAYSGKAVRARARVWVPVGSEATFIGWYFNNTNSTAAPATAVVAGNQYDLDGVWTLPFGMVNGTRTGIRTTNSANSSDVSLPTSGNLLYFKNVVWSQVGAIMHLPLDEGYGYEMKDSSTNKLHAVITTSGVSHVIAQNRPHHFRGTTNTNGNQQMLGQVLIPANSQILRVRARAQTNTPTITIGNASGGAQIVASVALSTTWKDLTIALTGGICSSDTSIWIGSNSTDVVEIDITAEPLSP